MGVPPLISLRSASLVRGGRTVLRELHFDIAQGEHVAILGPNGSGKSSFIRLVACQDYPLAHPGGEPPVRILGRDRWDVFELRSHLGLVSADLHAAYTARDGYGRTLGMDVVLSGFFASFGLFDHLEVTAAMRDRARAALALVEAEPLAGQPLGALSTGEARRLLIARALAPDPGALLLDEPTASLDLAVRQRFLAMVSRLAGLGKTVILVTHHVEEVIPEIQRVILLKEGRVYGDGPKEEVLRSGPLSGLFGMPVHVRRHGWHYSAVPDLLPPHNSGCSA